MTSDPYNEVVADSKTHAEAWARLSYGTKNPDAAYVGPSRDGRKTYRVYERPDEDVTPS